MITQTQITRWKGDACSDRSDDVAREREVRITCGTYSFATYCSPEDYIDLGVGHAYSEGLAASGVPHIAVTYGQTYDELDIVLDRNDSPKKRALPALTLSHGAIQSMARHIAEFSPLFDKTGAFHYAFIFAADGSVLASRADIGRFNAIDKAVGHCIRTGIGLEDNVLFTTGRISGRTVSKAVALGTPVIVSKAPPFFESVLMAESNGITIVGFARNDSFNIYTIGRTQVE